MQRRIGIRGAGAALALWLAACGGGGGGGGQTPVDTSPRQPQASVVRDDNPTAARLNLGPADFLPVSSTARFTFDRLDAAGLRLGSTTLDFTPSMNQVRTVEADDGAAFETLDYAIGPTGWVLPDLRNTQLPAGAQAIIGAIVQYPSPFHGIGTTRVQFRSGNYGLDIDGDGVNESFEFEFRQTMVGYETVPGPTGALEALHIRNELLLTVIPSKRASANLRASATADTWLARDVGPVRETVRSLGSDGRDVFPPYTLALTQALVGGSDPLDVNAIRQVQTLDLVNRDLVFDEPRGRYYASVPGSVLGQGNRIAIVDAGSGTVSYSEVVGSEPGVMALAADGRSLYVALDGSSELLRLALPGLAEIGRMRLPADSGFGPYVTESLAASPTDPEVVALSLAYTGLSPRHAGVLLVRSLQPMPQRTQGHTGSNAIVFGADGQWLYGMNNETTEFGLRRIEVQAAGLVERQVMAGAVPQFYLQSIMRTAQGLILGNRLHAEGTLAPLGQVAGAAECVALRSARLACVTSTFDSAFDLLLADAGNSTLLARLHGPIDIQGTRRVLVPGPSGQLAVRDGISHPALRVASRIRLLRHSALP